MSEMPVGKKIVTKVVREVVVNVLVEIVVNGIHVTDYEDGHLNKIPLADFVLVRTLAEEI